jgi:hypothetical protein
MNVKYVVDEISPSEWYIGVAEDDRALKSEKKWVVFKLENTGTTVDVNTSSDMFESCWNDRLTLDYLDLSEISLDVLEVLDTSLVNDNIATIDSTGGTKPIVYSILTDVDNKFKITGDKLQLLNTVSAPDTHNVTIRATDNKGVTYDKEFTITVLAGFESKKSILLDGVDENIRYDGLGAANVTSDASFCFWIKTADSTGYRTWLNVKDGGTQKLYFQTSSTAKLSANFTGTLGGNGVAMATTLTDNLWHFICVTYSSTSNKMIIYVDGVFNVDKTTAIGDLLDLPNGVMILGSAHSGTTGSNNTNGHFDDFSVFNVELSPAKILEYYNNGKPSDLEGEAGLVLYSRLGDETSGSTQLSAVGVSGALTNFNVNTVSNEAP